MVDVRLIDFDLCRSANHVPPADMRWCGARGFLAPEMMTNTVVDHTKLDVWSSACVLLELVMGSVWFEQEWLRIYREFRWQGDPTTPANLERIVRLSERAVHARNSCQHPGVVEMLRGSMHVNPTARMSAQDALDRLPRPIRHSPSDRATVNAGLKCAAGVGGATNAPRTPRSDAALCVIFRASVLATSATAALSLSRRLRNGRDARPVGPKGGAPGVFDLHFQHSAQGVTGICLFRNATLPC